MISKPGLIRVSVYLLSSAVSSISRKSDCFFPGFSSNSTLLLAITSSAKLFTAVSIFEKKNLTASFFFPLPNTVKSDYLLKIFIYVIVIVMFLFILNIWFVLVFFLLHSSYYCYDCNLILMELLMKKSKSSQTFRKRAALSVSGRISTVGEGRGARGSPACTTPSLPALSLRLRTDGSGSGSWSRWTWRTSSGYLTSSGQAGLQLPRACHR